MISAGKKDGIYGNALARHRVFWAREKTDRPLLAVLPGFYVNERFISTIQKLHAGLLSPDDIHTDLFLKDCERLYHIHREIGDDYPFVASPFAFVPWMEAIMGCPVMASPNSLWAEPCVADWKTWRWMRPALENPWARKLLELMQALVKHSNGRYPVAPTLMRGPSDILSAMRGAGQFPMDFMDYPETMKRAVDLCADVWIEIGKAQHALIPDSEEGYMDGDRGFRLWAPERIIWLQEDAMALLSPTLYRGFILPADRRIAKEFPAVAFHLHDTGMWAIDDLLAESGFDVIELNMEAATTDIEGTFASWKKIHARKPLIIWRIYGNDFWQWLDRVMKEFSPGGLSIQVTVRNLDEAKMVCDGFMKRAGK